MSFRGCKHKKSSKIKISLARQKWIKRTLKERFYKRVNKTRYCWNWTGAVGSKHPNKGGYGIFFVNKTKIRTHRLVWILTFGKIPKKLCVLHKCDNRLCVRPCHLFLGTQLDNMRDRFKKKRGIIPWNKGKRKNDKTKKCKSNN